jgi:small subunit ribosomal protein S13
MAELQSPPPPQQPTAAIPAPPASPIRSTPSPTPSSLPFKHIIRIANVDLEGKKQIRWALTKIKGVGINFADAICSLAHVAKTSPAGQLTEQQVVALDRIMVNPIAAGLPIWMTNRRKDYESNEDKHLITGTLIYQQDNDLKLMKRIRSYRGVRHMQGQPVRGQRTRSNFRRNKGKVIGVVKKKIAPGAEGKEKEKGKEKK